MNWFTQICAALALGLLAGLPALAVPGHGLVLQEGKLLGWGDNHYGQLGAGQPAQWAQARALALPGGLVLTAVVAAGRHSVGLDRGGRVWAWGDNSSGQLGQGHARAVAGPVQAQGLPARAVMLAAGNQHTLALLADGTVWTWGANMQGQLGHGAIDVFAPVRAPTAVPLPSSTRGAPVKAVVAGDDFSLARLADGRVVQWGSGATQPALVADLPAVQRIRARGALAMAQDAQGRFWQWQPGPAPAARPRASTALAYAELAAPTPPGAAVTRVAAAPSAPSAVTPGAKVLVTPGSARGSSPALALARAEARPGADETSSARIPPPGARVAESSSGQAQPGMTTAGGQPLAPTPTAPAPPPPVVPKAAPAAVTPVLPSAGAAPGVAPLSTPARAEAPARALQISGRVLLAGSRTDGLEQAQVSADGAPCGATDAQGRFTCTVPAGWSGRLVVRKNNFRISPSALSYRNLQGDASGQDFAAVYDPR